VKANVGIDPAKQGGDGALMEPARRWAHQQLAIDELVPVAVFRQRQDLLASPDPHCVGHDHRVAASAIGKQGCTQP
jgi:hypothetical protein